MSARMTNKSRLAGADHCLPRLPDDRSRTSRSWEWRCRRSERTSGSRRARLRGSRNAYLLTFGGFLLLAGRLGDLFSHRRLFPDWDHGLHARVHSLAGSRRHRRSSSALERYRDSAGAVVLRSGALTYCHPFHRAGRTGEGHGRLRFRRRGRRIDRCTTGRNTHQHAQLALDLPRQCPDRGSRRRDGQDGPPRQPHHAIFTTSGRRGRSRRHHIVDAGGLRHRERQPGRLGRPVRRSDCLLQLAPYSRCFVAIEG